MAGSIQFRGIDQVMQAFQNRDVEAWSVWQHKQFMFKGCGDADLRTLLENLQTSATNAIYTIRVYETINDVKNIKEKSDCDGSFNFRLDGEGQEITGTQYSNFGRITEMQNKIAELEQKLIEADSVDDEPETIGSVVNTAVVEIIKDPSKALQWLEVLKNILPGSFPAQQQQPIMRVLPAAAAVGNVHTAAPVDDNEKLDRLAKAIDTLEAEDPKLIIHLEKLADMAINKPGRFKNLLLMLETF